MLYRSLLRSRTTVQRCVRTVLLLAVCSAATGWMPQVVSGQERVWVEHSVIPGERLHDIAKRYGVTTEELVRWNRLNETRPVIVVGRPVRVHAIDPPPQRDRRRYRIRPGDSWSRIARTQGVDITDLRKHWNPKMGKVLQAGAYLTLWVEVPRSPAAEQASAEEEPEDAQGRSQSVGRPTSGRIHGLAQIPPRPDLYTVRNPNHAYGSTHAIALVQQGIETFRARSGYSGALILADMSQRRGGRLRPHRSHQSGRDIDIRLPLRDGLGAHVVPERADQVDWDATWHLVRAMLDTHQVIYIFLSSTRQKHLREAALRSGMPRDVVNDLIQFPRRAAAGVVRHSRGHTKHIHVRFTCAEYESRCRD